MPAGLTPTITANDLAKWSVGNNYTGINGPLTGSTYAISSDKGINNGFGEDGLAHQFTFTFTGQSQAWFAALENVVGVGAHVQRGPNGCSAKVGVTRSGAVDNYDLASATREGCISVPEPESMVLLATGLLGLGFVALRRRNGLPI